MVWHVKLLYIHFQPFGTSYLRMIEKCRSNNGLTYETLVHLRRGFLVERPLKMLCFMTVVLYYLFARGIKADNFISEIQGLSFLPLAEVHNLQFYTLSQHSLDEDVRLLSSFSISGIHSIDHLLTSLTASWINLFSMHNSQHIQFKTISKSGTPKSIIHHNSRQLVGINIKQDWR